MTQKLPAQPLFEQSILDNAFYQPDIKVDNKKFQNDRSIIEQQNYINDLTSEVKQCESELINGGYYSFYENSFYGLSIIALLLAGLWFITSEWFWSFIVHDINSRIFAGFPVCLLGFIPCLAGGFYISDLIPKMTHFLFKKTKAGKKLRCKINDLWQKINLAQKQVNEQTEQKMTEQYFFQTLKQFDALSERIKARYPEHFIQHCNSSEQYSLEILRTNLVDDFSNKKHKAFCMMAESLDSLEENFETVWQIFKATDKITLMKKYNQFLEHNHSEITDAL